ncbi:uncharacterized [Tachysurus ichikawai]
MKHLCTFSISGYVAHQETEQSSLYVPRSFSQTCDDDDDDDTFNSLIDALKTFSDLFMKPPDDFTETLQSSGSFCGI